MASRSGVNDFVLRFANVNGTGSASANTLFAKAVFRMGLPVAAKNIFPSNIQGLPTWYEVRVSEKGYLGRREGIDLLVAVNPQSMEKDIRSVAPGGYLVYDDSKQLPPEWRREDIRFLGIPMIRMGMEHFPEPRTQLLMKNVIYVGALTALLDLDPEVVKALLHDQFGEKEKLIAMNIKALELGRNYALEHFDCPLGLRLEKRDLNRGKIMVDGNTATALGALYAGATVAAWYPITPSTSVMDAFAAYCEEYRKDPVTGKNRFAIVQAEDELASIGVVVGAGWNGARAFTATSGPGISLMTEFLGLAYFAEIPAVVVNVQRGGPSTGMPTRTQQADLISSAYASHGDTRHVLLFPSDPGECFELTAQAFDLAERLQTPVLVMTDLDLGMNDHVCHAFSWKDDRSFDRGKVLGAEELEQLKTWGRYLDVDGDGITYRTLPGTHPQKGAFFTRGTSKDEYARYTEDNDAYKRNVDRLMVKWATAARLVPPPELLRCKGQPVAGMLYFGTTAHAAREARDQLAQEGIFVEGIRIRSLPFHEEVRAFLDRYDRVYVVEQNRDAQMRTLLIQELDVPNHKLIPVLHYDGFPIPADTIYQQIRQHWPAAVNV
ncbi:MAG: 2-oxoacid:acceptor oxidoreductase subunit alpha [Saprospiraceae bacterium]|nr:2-oxoacid:acceptor oxidoreductase subunit alpha [Saprospiraceae bacterium]